MKKSADGRRVSALRLLVTRVTAVMLVLTSVGAVTISGRAQVSTSEYADLHHRLDAARADIARIQAAANSVEAQIASIDAQVAAVAAALEASRELVERTQARIGVLERDIARNEQTFRRTQQRVEDIAVSLYKSGATAELDVFLSADSIEELSSSMEYSSAATAERIQVMVKSRRLQAELDADKAQLEVTLADALEAEEEQERHAQHLRELREAQAAKLANLRDRIEASRQEAAAIQARSEEIAEQLAANIPPSAPPVSAGASGFAWPINGAVTSGFGSRWGGTHAGIDIDCVTGDPIRASKSGSVLSATYDDGYGYHIVIDHGGGFASLYAHASKLYVSGGQSVSQGKTIAACGSTGQSTGDHLHFEIRVNGATQDPLGYLP
jgi:murein DD-endopeptidase MepM/ murein hydrolase activator NlpD